MSECDSCTRSSAQVDVLQRQPASQWTTYSPSIDEWIHNKAQPPHCMHVCVIITVSVWPWWKIITLSCTLDTIHVLSIFWIIVIYFYYRCQCLDLFPIRGGIYHTSNLHSLPAQRRKEHRGERRRTAKVAAGREMVGNVERGMDEGKEARRQWKKRLAIFTEVCAEVVRRECMWTRRMIMWHDTSEMRGGLPWQEEGRDSFSRGLNKTSCKWCLIRI